MRVLVTWFLVGLVLLGGVVPVSGDEATRDAGVKWAKRVAMDFLETACETGHYADIAGLLSPDLARAVSEDSRWPFAGLYCDPRFTSEELAPNGSEVLFTGVLKATEYYHDAGGQDADFTLRVAKESASGKWSIRFLRVKEREEKHTKEEQHR
jgi:hypothetical protein